jgi:colicin import membrane protein
LQQQGHNIQGSTASAKWKAVAGSALVHLALVGGLILYGFSTPHQNEQNDGILVNFGLDETGSGAIEPSPPAMPEIAATPVQKKSAVAPQEEALITQDKEEAPVVKKVDPDAAKKKLEKTEADRKLKEEMDAEKVRIQQEEIEKQKIAAEQKRQSDIMNRTKNALANARNSGTNSTSEGIAGGTGNQGVPTGSVDSKNHGPGGGTGTSGDAISYSLGGRGTQTLPDPKYNYQGEGRVVVEISVDRSGKVIQAIPGVKGSNTLDEYLLKTAKEAALATTFKVKEDAPEVQKGTITYNFKLR